MQLAELFVVKAVHSVAYFIKIFSCKIMATMALAEVSPPLSLFTIVPWKRISKKDPVSVVACASSILFMKENDDGWDPLMHGTHTTSNEMNGSKVVHALKILNA